MHSKVSQLIGLAAVLFMGLQASGHAAAMHADFYVSPTGNDAWSGTLAAPDAGRTDGPFRTLRRARDAVRRLKSDRTDKDILVLIRGRTYYLNETIVFELQDSAPPGCTITYAAYKDEKPVFSSGVRISNWKKLAKNAPVDLPAQAKGNVWVADIPKTLGRFYTLYDGDKCLPRASKGFSPTLDPVVKGPSYMSELERAEALSTVAFPKGALRSWPNIADVELVIRPFYPWVMNILPLESVDEETCTARTSIPGTYPLSRLWGTKPGEISAWIENVPEAPDSPGEWVLDTSKRKLYLWPKGNSPGDEIMASCLRELIRVEGEIDFQNPVDTPAVGLVFKGLTFTQADRGFWTKDDAGMQHDWEMIDKADALLRLRGARDCKVTECNFINSGGSAIRLDLYCQNNLISENEMASLGGAGVLMLGYGPGVKDVNKNNTVVNNHIHNIGEICWHSHAIVAWQSGNNRIANNYIHHCPRKAVCLSGVHPQFFDPKLKNRRECSRTIRWHEVGDARQWQEILPFLHTRNNVVDHNEVHHVLEMLGDGTAINCSGAGSDNIIRRNYVHDITNMKISGCIRTDDYQKGILIAENIVFRCGPGGITPKGENHLINNYLIDVGAVKGDHIHISGKWGPFGKSRIVNNIFFSTKPDQKFYYRLKPEELGEFEDCEVDNNIYFNGQGISAADNEFLKKLRKQGHNAKSFYGDPLFVDWQNTDFRLKPDSPVHKMPIKPIDLSSVGLTKDFPKRFRKSP